jgi:altronate dehydratase
MATVAVPSPTVVGCPYARLGCDSYGQLSCSTHDGLRRHTEDPTVLAAHLLLVLAASERRFTIVSEHHAAMQLTITHLQSQVIHHSLCTLLPVSPNISVSLSRST